MWRDRVATLAGWRDKANVLGPRRPLLPHPPFLSLLLPDQNCSQGDDVGRRPPKIPPPNRIF